MPHLWRLGYETVMRHSLTDVDIDAPFDFAPYEFVSALRFEEVIRHVTRQQLFGIYRIVEDQPLPRTCP